MTREFSSSFLVLNVTFSLVTMEKGSEGVVVCISKTQHCHLIEEYQNAYSNLTTSTNAEGLQTNHHNINRCSFMTSIDARTRRC